LLHRPEFRHGEDAHSLMSVAQPEPVYPARQLHLQLPVVPEIVPRPLLQYSRPLLPLSLAVLVATHELAVWHVEPE
jgi:nitrate reductase beta subunit